MCLCMRACLWVCCVCMRACVREVHILTGQWRVCSVCVHACAVYVFVYMCKHSYTPLM